VVLAVEQPLVPLILETEEGLSALVEKHRQWVAVQV
jgi:hypothetical protein